MFLSYELLERLWLRDLPYEALHAAHLVRGVGASLLALLASTAFLIRRRAVSSLGNTLEASVSSGAPGVELRARLAAWLIGLRWIAALAAGATVVIATLVAPRVEPAAAPRLWAGALLLFLVNAALAALGARRLAAPAALATQVIGDVLILGWLLHHAGGVQNPFAGFFVFHAVIAAVVLDPRLARRVAAAIAGFVLALTLLETASVFPPACLLDDVTGACAAPAGWTPIAAAGLAVAIMVMGSALIVSDLVAALHAERLRLARATLELSSQASAITSAQAQLQLERGNLQTIIDCMADAVVYAAPDGIVRLRNRTAQRFWSQDEGTTPGDDVRACHPTGIWDTMVASIANAGPNEPHPLFTVRDRTFEASYARVCDEGGSLRGVVMVARDVTERIEAQNWRMQEERMSVVGKMAAGLAHELNNPLGAIALFTQHALAEIRPDDPLAEHLGTVLRNANLCTKILRDLLEYARRRPPERRHVVLGEILGDVVRTLDPHAQSEGATLRCEDPAGALGAVVYGDPEQLRQVLVNLGLNAIEAMPRGGRVTFRVATGGARGGGSGAAQGGWARIEVEDEGSGIAPDELERIFSAFHTTKPEGTGLGLTVARDIVAAHGGTIEVRSTPGAGSTFTVALPTHEHGGGEADPTPAPGGGGDLEADRAPAVKAVRTGEEAEV
ncbi:MAG: hypothetical protein IT372_33495 [Polyangiaceae bacterium]|nr:hypothetical protein [Polyangiaceae bacterium]